MRWVFLVAVAACSARPPALHDDPQALAWRSRARVSDAAAKQIAAEAIGDARRRPAWSEPNHVHGSRGAIGDGSDKFVFGEARLYLGEYETDPGKFRQVDARDDAVMGYADCLFAMRQLERWSRDHGVSWEVRLGRSKGRIDAQGPDAAAGKILADLSHRAGDLLPAAAEAERPRLDAKYRDRR